MEEKPKDLMKGIPITDGEKLIRDNQEEIILKESFKKLYRHPALVERVTRIEKSIQDFIRNNDGQPQILYDAANHLIQAGGKRTRSLLSLLACESVGGDTEKALPLTIAAELLQTASLIHDDIIDAGTTRRGVETVHQKYGHHIAILAGDLLIAKSIEMIGKHGSTELLQHIGNGGVRMCEGEAIDLALSTDKPDVFSKDQYFKMIELKTVAFLSESARLGAMMGEGTEDHVEVLSEFGEHLGYAFQIQDDMLDMRTTHEESGKVPLADLKSRRCNFLLVHALEVSHQSHIDTINQAINEGKFFDAAEYILETGAEQVAMDLAEGYVKKAKETLLQSNLRGIDLLNEFADSVIHRNR
ncbi:MAG: hypothetical protein BAJATHORv1_30037 [Candidatus Thorarchaeota archaeon]|nr:MAG: hypothetical protein BAJATHORv1_30037 [Candidatus Thorarchaeota archaeon]